jgi:Uma2 family endonuclease
MARMPVPDQDHRLFTIDEYLALERTEEERHEYIVEVLSPSTEAFDRGEKFRRYRAWLPTLTDYVLVAQDSPLIDHYHRQEDGTWVLRALEGLQTHMHLGTIGCTVPLADVYERIVFPTAPTAEEPEG